MDCALPTLVLAGSVVTTVSVYARAAFDAFHGVVPGAYVSLLFYAPLGLLATSMPLIATVVRTLVPSVAAAAMIVLSAVAVTAFQASVVSGRLGLIGVLAVVNLLLYVAAASAQGALSLETTRKVYARRRRLADALAAAAAQPD